MSVDRKTFLEMAVSGGLGALFGGSIIPDRWSHNGVSLTSVSRQSVAMGSVISFQVVAETESAGYEAIRKAEDVFRRMEHIFSMYDNESEMAELARRAGKTPLSSSEDAVKLLKFAKEIHTRSRGKFDITVEPAMRQWGFRKNPGESINPPTARELRYLERIIGSDKIRIEEDRVLLEEAGMAIDTGGIAGGYALDQAMKVMKGCDISAAFINFSGDIHCFGNPLDAEGWPVHILDPATRQPLQDPVMLNNEALSTSGAYQNRRHDRSDHSWGHLLMPGTAEPVETTGSVTAIHSSAMEADAWSTAVYVGAEAPSEVRTIILDKS